MKKQEDLIWQKEWDTLIILDSCRYDIFQKTYAEYISGKLIPVYSPGSHTLEWISEIVKGADFDDTIYLSTIPFINSKTSVSVPYPDLSDDFKAARYFGKIVDVWDFAWDEEGSMVRPQDMKDILLKVDSSKPSGEKLIAHFMQPHYPYIGTNLGKKNPSFPKDSDRYISKIESIKRWIKVKVSDSLPGRFSLAFLKLKNSLGYPLTPIGETYLELGKSGLRRAYEKTLRSVLSSISSIMDKLSGKVVITADHGECLGNSGLGHYPGSDKTELRTVPWFNVKLD